MRGKYAMNATGNTNVRRSWIVPPKMRSG